MLDTHWRTMMNELRTDYSYHPNPIHERPSTTIAQGVTAHGTSHRPPVVLLARRTPAAHEVATLERIWSRSQDEDEPAGRPPNGWWSITNWATGHSTLTESDQTVGFAAIEYQPGADAAEARVGLLPAHRSHHNATRLIEATFALAGDVGASQVRLYMPEAAAWARDAARERGFTDVRTQHVMVRAADTPPLASRQVAGVQIRALHDGEEPALLAALNRAWADTWNVRPLTAAALARDLAGQRTGMLVAVDSAQPTLIVATSHALFNPNARNPDGYPYAWISNLTTDPLWRGRGLGRAMLAAGLDHLTLHGARSIALGVDGGNTTAIALYRRAGFRSISTVSIVERTVEAAVADPRVRHTMEHTNDRA
jgi:mycothiol synthase